MTTTIDGLTGEQFIQHVARLAVAVCTDGTVADDLALAARALADLADDPSGRSLVIPGDPRLRYGRGSAPVAAAAAADRMADVRRRVDTGGGFLAASAGQIRRVFTLGQTSVADWLGCHCLTTLPRELPADDATPVVLYATGKNAAAPLLSAVGRGEDPAAAITCLTNRIVHKHRYPWE